MKKHMKTMFGPAAVAAASTCAWVAAGSLLLAQSEPNRLTIPFSDPSRPGTVRVNVFRGGITVKVWSGREVVVTTEARPRESRAQPLPEAVGLRLLGQASGMTVEEENNVMSIGTGRFGSRSETDVDLQVPARTNLKRGAVTGGEVLIEGVEGDIEVSNVNGDILLTEVAGTVVAHATNGDVRVSLKQVTPEKPMSFSSLNGDVDITLPPALKANLKLRSDRGDVYTDFDVQVQQRSTVAGPRAPRPPLVPPVPPGPPQAPSRGRTRGTRVEIDNAIYGSVNGGGPEFELRTFNGNIFLRKGK